MPLIVYAQVLPGHTNNETEANFTVSVKVNDPNHDANSAGNGYNVPHSLGLTTPEQINDYLLELVKQEFTGRRPEDRFFLLGGVSGVLVI